MSSTSLVGFLCDVIFILGYLCYLCDVIYKLYILGRLHVADLHLLQYNILYWLIGLLFPSMFAIDLLDILFFIGLVFLCKSVAEVGRRFLFVAISLFLRYSKRPLALFALSRHLKSIYCKIHSRICTVFLCAIYFSTSVFIFSFLGYCVIKCWLPFLGAKARDYICGSVLDIYSLNFLQTCWSGCTSATWIRGCWSNRPACSGGTTGARGSCTWTSSAYYPLT